MNRCPNCHYENVPTSTFCEHCGTSLSPTSSPLEPTHRASDGTLIPFPPPPPPYSYQHSPVALPPSASRKRTVGRTIFSLLLYLWSAFWFSFGLAGGLFYYVQSNSVILILLFAACLVLLIPLLLYRKHLYLKWGKRLALEIGLLFMGGILISIISVAMRPAPGYTSPSFDYTFGGILVLYGIAAALVAFW